MKSWKNNRPDGWDVAQIAHDNEHCCGAEDTHCWIEAGADAMLGAVNSKLVPLGIEFKDDGMYHRTGRDNQFPYHNWARIVRRWARQFGKCRVIFIPDEEVKE